MKKIKTLLTLAATLAVPASSLGVVIDFAGGVATTTSGPYVPTDNGGYASDVISYVEDGMLIEFLGAPVGVIGNYYDIGPEFVQNSVIHAHWDSGITAVRFSKVDQSTFSLNYVEITSNAIVGGGQQNGTELSFITPNAGAPVLLPSSDWGFGLDYFGGIGDGVETVFLGPAFDNITSFTITSQNAYCFGMDNFFIDEEFVPAPEAGSAALLLGLGAGALAGWRRRS